MRNLGFVVIAGAVVAGSLAQAAYTVKLRREVKALAARLPPQDQGDGGAGIAGSSVGPEGAPGRRALSEARSVPAFVPAPAPLPEAIASEPARELLRGFVAAELARIKHDKDEAKRVKKEEKQQRKAAQNEKSQAEFRDRLARELGLGEPEARRFGEILAESEKARRALREAEKAGQATPADTATALAALRTKLHGELRSVLGDNWSVRLQEVDRRMQESRKKDQEARGAASGPFWFVSNAPARP